jgi:hypothetical protein
LDENTLHIQDLGNLCHRTSPHSCQVELGATFFAQESAGPAMLIKVRLRQISGFWKCREALFTLQSAGSIAFERLKVLSEVLWVLIQVLGLRCKPRPYWLCGFPSLNYYRFTFACPRVDAFV